MKHTFIIALSLTACGGSDFNVANSTARSIPVNDAGGVPGRSVDATKAAVDPFGSIPEVPDTGPERGTDSGVPPDSTVQQVCPVSSLIGYCENSYSVTRFPCNYTPEGCMGSILRPHAVDVRCCK